MRSEGVPARRGDIPARSEGAPVRSEGVPAPPVAAPARVQKALIRLITAKNKGLEPRA